MDEIETELRRIQRRWRELPQEKAAGHAPRLRTVVQRLADQTHGTTGAAVVEVPELGTAALPDQLAVMVYDAREAGLERQVLAALRELRRQLP